MKYYDFVMIYEHKVRELECLCLLKMYLEKRGYSILLKCLHDKQIFRTSARIRKPSIHAKVLVVYACYNNTTLQRCVENYISFEKVIDFQWEQMIARSQEKGNSYRNFAGIGKEVVHISWGLKNRKRLIEQAGIPEDKVFLTGNMSLDFLRPEFSTYYKSKEQICKQYGFPLNSKICILFANYRGADVDEEQVKSWKEQYGESRVAVLKLGKKTKEVVLEWIEKAARDFQDYVFIYRPHPGENTKEVEEKFAVTDNVYIISEYSSKQWIFIADFLFSWHSTVVVETFIKGKTCYSLEPFGYIAEEDNAIFENMQGIKEYKSLKNVLEGQNFDIELNEEEIINIFGEYDTDEPNYVKVGRVLETVLKEEKYGITDSKELAQIYTTQYHSMKERIWANVLVNNLYWKYMKLLSSSSHMRSKRRGVQCYYNKKKIMEKEVASEEEIKNIEERIAKVVGI